MSAFALANSLSKFHSCYAHKIVVWITQLDCYSVSFWGKSYENLVQISLNWIMKKTKCNPHDINANVQLPYLARLSDLYLTYPSKYHWLEALACDNVRWLCTIWRCCINSVITNVINRHHGKSCLIHGGIRKWWPMSPWRQTLAQIVWQACTTAGRGQTGFRYANQSIVESHSNESKKLANIFCPQ